MAVTSSCETLFRHASVQEPDADLHHQQLLRARHDLHRCKQCRQTGHPQSNCPKLGGAGSQVSSSTGQTTGKKRHRGKKA